MKRGNDEKPIILLTEDDEATRAALLAIFADEGYSTIAVADIAAARSELARHPFAVLLLDSQHAVGGHGVDWLVDFAGHEGAPRTIIVSGARDAEELGARFGVRVVKKPFDIDELVNAVVAAADAGRPKSGSHL